MLAAASVAVGQDTGIAPANQIQLPANVTKGWDLVYSILTGKWVLLIVIGIIFAAAFQLRAGKMNLDAVKQNAGALLLLLAGPAFAAFLYSYLR